MWQRFVRAGRARRDDGARRLGVVAALGLALALALGGCGATSAPGNTVVLPSGSYTSQPYHFALRYPTGWKLLVATQTSTAIPLEVEVTHTGALKGSGSLISTFNVSVLNAQDANVQEGISALQRLAAESNSPLRPVTIAGKSAYQEGPIQQAIPNSQDSEAHTDYYILLHDYEYKISTDAITSDNANADLSAMLASFTVLQG